MPPRAVPQSRLQRASGHSGVAGAGVPVRTPGALTYVRVAEGVLGVAGRARARLGAPVTQAPAAQEHDEPEPGSHCCCRCWGCCSPLQSCCARRWRSRCSRGSPTRRCGATLALGALPSECPAGRDGSRRGCLGAGARLQGPPLSLGQGAGAGAGAGKAAGGEAVREPASCPTLRRCRAADRYSAVSPSARPSDQSPSRITSSTPSEKGAGLWGGATRTVQILIGNNTAVGTRVGGLGRASDPRRGVALSMSPLADTISPRPLRPLGNSNPNQNQLLPTPATILPRVRSSPGPGDLVCTWWKGWGKGYLSTFSGESRGEGRGGGGNR